MIQQILDDAEELGSHCKTHCTFIINDMYDCGEQEACGCFAQDPVSLCPAATAAAIDYQDYILSLMGWGPQDI